MSAIITGLTADQMLAQFEALIDDSLDQTTELFLLNEVKDTLETKRAWALLTALDTSKTAPAGVAWQTPILLPSDFGLPSPRGIYVGTDLIPYKQIPFESQVDFQAITYAYFIDFYNGQYYLCGTPTPGNTVRFFYRRTSGVLALVNNGGTPWVFPARFHPILPYKMAQKYFAIDQGDKGRSWDDRWGDYVSEMEQAMNDWDAQIQTNALSNEPNFLIDISADARIVDMDAGGGGMLLG